MSQKTVNHLFRQMMKLEPLAEILKTMANQILQAAMTLAVGEDALNM